MSIVTPSPTSAEPEGLYEVVDSRVVEKTPMGAFEVWIASRLTQAMGAFATANRLGQVVTEMLFVIDEARELKRRPDVAYVSFDRWPRGRRIPRTAAWEVIPDLAIEVVSATNTADEVLAKIHEYFRASVRRVWVVYPSTVQVYDYDSPTTVRILARAEELDGGAVLPGFRLPLAMLFEDEDQTD